MFEDAKMNPYDLFDSSGVYKVAVMYFSGSRGLAVVGRHVGNNHVEVLQISGEVDPHTGKFTALDYTPCETKQRFPVVTRAAFDNLIGFIAARVEELTPMSVIEPDRVRSIMSHSFVQEPSQELH